MKNINDLRELLFDSIAKISNGEIDAVKGNAISNISKNIIDSAKLEFDVMKHTQQDRSAFFLPASKQEELIEQRVKFGAQQIIEEKLQEGQRQLTEKICNNQRA